jgi:hypothetical protein
MTEAEWLACEDPTPMLWFLKGKVSDRKLRLFAAACCRKLDLSTAGYAAVRVAEAFADGRRPREALDDARRAIEHPRGRREPPDATADAPLALTQSGLSAFDGALQAAAHAARLVGAWPVRRTWQVRGTDQEQAAAAERCYQADILRCVVGHPFRRPAPVSAWRNPTVDELAQTAYDARSYDLPRPLDPDRLAVLADALEDAGCTDAALLEHCCGSGPHVRGCWVVDLILGKS